ncbi:putative inorganic phosphate cotransporter isoform X2 [Rhodnius prolixus]|uniref:putative inorganic phosphate cotransporter isoform X2 n=1 Tax=Rhodnius prolixus TaxID=13249 RepID=UPI003D18E814
MSVEEAEVDQQSKDLNDDANHPSLTEYLIKGDEQAENLKNNGFMETLKSIDILGNNKNEGNVEEKIRETNDNNKSLQLKEVSDRNDDNQQVLERTEIPLDQGEPTGENERRQSRRSKCISEENLAKNVLTFILFLGMVNAYFLRINIVITIDASFRHTKLSRLRPVECVQHQLTNNSKKLSDSPFRWTENQRTQIVNAFFYGHCISQLPSGILVHRFGSKLMLGIGMVINTILGFLTPITASYGFIYLFILRFIQGIVIGPVIPSSYTILANWTPPNERSRRVAAINCGAQIGMAITMSISKYIASNEMIGGWATMFYISNGFNTLWLISLYELVYEDPVSHPTLKKRCKINILSSVWGTEIPRHNVKIPWKEIFYSPPAWGITLAALANRYGYEILLTEIPIYINDVLDFSYKKHAFFAAMPFCFMAIFAMMFSFLLDELITHKKISIATARKIGNTIGYASCDPFLTLAILSIGLGVNGAIYSGYVANHIDISPNYVCILVAMTTFIATGIGFIAPVLASYALYGEITFKTWGEIFFLAIGQYIICNLCYMVFVEGKRQPWDTKIPWISIEEVDRALSVYGRIRR